MMIRTIWALLNGVIGTAIFSVFAITGGLARHRGSYYDWVARTWSRWILWASGVRVTIEGQENIKDDRAQIIASNHQSWFDVWVLAAHVPKRNRFIAKEELKGIPLFGKAWIAAGHISINRQDRKGAIRALEKAAQLVRGDNSSIIIFPEGTRSDDGKLLPFKKGAFMLALHTGIEIVPTAMIGTRGILKKGDWRVRSGPVIVRFGEPINTASFDDDNRDELLVIVRDRIEKMLDHPARQRDE